MEGHIHHTLWSLWTFSHVLWTVQLATNLSSLHGLSLWRHDHRRVAHHLYGQCPCICWNQGRMPRTDQTGTWENARRGSPPQTNQVCLWSDGGGVLRTGGQKWRSTNGSHQTQGCTQLGTTQVSKSSSIIYRVLQLLCSCSTSPQLDQERSPLWLKKEQDDVFIKLKEVFLSALVVCMPDTTKPFLSWQTPPWLLLEEYLCKRCQQRPPSLCLPLCYILPCQVELWHLW